MTAHRFQMPNGEILPKLIHDYKDKDSQTHHNVSHYQHVIRSLMEKYYLILYMITNIKNLKHTTMQAITIM